MLRDPSLIPLSQQHHNGLALCVLTRRSLCEDASAANVAKLAQRAIDRYELELANHFEIEEQILFPAVQKSLGELPLLAELIAQHREFECLIAQLRAAPSAALLEQLCELLSRHIRREESELFEMAQSRLPEPVLRELGTAIESKVVRVCL
ncbi:MAG: hemerythrin domain-containing protein [Bryobacteraceae bacterium]|jgi:hemerythrin-like domain-containing protein